MTNKTIDIHYGDIDETVFLSDIQEIKKNPYYGFLSDYYDLNQFSKKKAERYVSSKDLATLLADLRRMELKKNISNYVLNKSLSEKLFILDFIKNGHIDPEKNSQTLYFELNLETDGVSGLNKDNGSRIDFLIWWAHYFTQQMDALKEQGVKICYIKVLIKKNPTDDTLYIESIDAVENKN